MIRNLFLLSVVLFLMPLCSVSQDCNIQKETDPYTKELKLTTGFINFKNARLSVQADIRQIDFFFILSGIDKCFSDAATAQVFFEGSKVKFNVRNSGSMNCEGFFHFGFKNQAATPSSLQRMTNLLISGILFIGNDKSETQVTLTTEQQLFLMHNVSCLVEQAKKLLPG